MRKVVETRCQCPGGLSTPEIQAATVLRLTGLPVAGSGLTAGVTGPVVRVIDVPPTVEAAASREGAWPRPDDPGTRGGATADSPDAFEAIEAMRVYSL